MVAHASTWETEKLEVTLSYIMRMRPNWNIYDLILWEEKKVDNTVHYTEVGGLLEHIYLRPI